jgi:hypothetical protein
MDKKPTTLPAGGYEKVVYGDFVVFVKPFLSQSEMEALIVSYIEDFIKGPSFTNHKAEMFLMMEVMSRCTNIDMLAQNEGGRLLIGPDEMFENYDLYEQVISKIKNYKYFRSLLDFSVSEIMEQRRLELSLGRVVENVSEKILGAITNVANGGLSEDSIKSIQNLLNQVNSSPVVNELASIMKEGSKTKKPSRPRKPKAK